MSQWLNKILLILLIITISFFVKHNKVSAIQFTESSKVNMWGGGGSKGTASIPNFRFGRYECEADEYTLNYVIIDNSQGCTVISKDVFGNQDVNVIVKINKIINEGIDNVPDESIRKTFIIKPNAFKINMNVGETYNIDTDLRQKGFISYNFCRDISIGNPNVLQKGECQALSGTALDITALSSGEDVVEVKSTSGINFRGHVTVRGGSSTGPGIIDEPFDPPMTSESVKLPEEQRKVCEGLLGPVLKKDLENVLKIIRILGPLMVILLTSTELIGAMVNKDDDALKKGMGRLTTRIILVAVLFFLPSLLNILLSWVDTKYSTCF